MGIIMQIVFGPIIVLSIAYAIHKMILEFRSRRERDWATIGILFVLVWLQFWFLVLLAFGPDMVGWFE
jgi:uncharacterized membrane protein (DUF373 family)